MSDFYWELTYGDFRDLKRVKLPPAAVGVVRRRWDRGEPVHIAGRASIPANQIRSLEKTSEPFGQPLLLEEAARAFNEPLYNEEGAIQSKWVKKPVTHDRYNRYYAALPAYHRLADEGDMAMMAFRVPTHLIDYTIVSDCTDEETKRLQ
jgi:hypothetical protein